MKLLDGILIIDFSQFLSGPSASLRLVDMGARVIKVEKPETGDICRQLYVSEVEIEGDSTIFHTINRNKESFTASIKEEKDKKKLWKLISQADVVMHNFRPGVMERLGFSFKEVKEKKDDIIYAEINGYGEEGNWKHLPGQDLLLQSLTGLPFLNGEVDKQPIPMGVSVVDILAGNHLAQGILAALYRRENIGEGALIQVSMLESSLDYQFEVFTTYLNDGHQLPERSQINHAHAYVAAPYGVYQSKDGFLALAMGDIRKLKDLLSCQELSPYNNPKEWFEQRDEIKKILANHLLHEETQFWLNILEPADIWCAKVLNIEELLSEESYKILEMEMEVKTSNGKLIKTTRCPFRINGKKLISEKAAPFLGEHSDAITKEFQL